MNRIREVRRLAGLTQAALFRQLKWTQARLSNYELGIRNPGLNEARSIVGALNDLGADCTLDEVFPPSLPPTSQSKQQTAHNQAA